MIGMLSSGRTTICKLLTTQYWYKCLDYKEIEEYLKKKLGTEDEPVETVDFS